MMIVSLEPKEHIPCGQLAIAHHPGLLCLHFHRNEDGGQNSLLGTLSQVSLNDMPKVNHAWKLRVHNNIEEELYFSSHTIIWSRGHVVLKIFTIDSMVKQVVWSDFVADGQDSYQFNLPEAKSDTNTCRVSGVSVIADGVVHTYSEDGDDYVTNLPFQARDAWNFKFGLLIERNKPSDQVATKQNFSNMSSIVNSPKPDNELTTIFCLQHPLKEFTPVICKTQGTVRYMNRPQDRVVYCEDDFVFTCDVRQGLHTVWKARKVCLDDVNALQTSSAKQNQNHQMSSLCQMSMMSSPSHVSSPFRTSAQGNIRTTPSLHAATFTSGSGMNAKTPFHNSKLSHLSPHIANNHRLFSPSTSLPTAGQHMFSPMRHSPHGHVTRSPCTPVSHDSLCLNYNSVLCESSEPLRPEICLTHMWSESLTSTRDGLDVGQTTRVFRVKDLCGQSYLAYIIDSLSQLRLVRYSSASNDKQHLIFGAVTCMQSTQDAVPLHNHNMMAVLDFAGCVNLYSGPSKVVKMNLTGLPLASMNLSHGGLHNTAPVSAATPQPISTPAHPSRPTSAMANIDDVGQPLSPVPELNSSEAGGDISVMTGDEFGFSSTAFASKVTRLPHWVGSSLVLEVGGGGGGNYRVDVPPVCSSHLVNTCLQALRYALPNTWYQQLVITWYSARHTPGAMNGCKEEWNLFVSSLLEFAGSNHSAAAASKFSSSLDVSASPVVAAKKQRQMEWASDDDWEHLLKSKYDEVAGDSSSKPKQPTSCKPDVDLEHVTSSLRHQHVASSLQRKPSFESSLTGDSTQLPTQLLMSIFCALHLVYEEQKLSTVTWPNVALMSPFLYRMATDIGMPIAFLRNYALHNPARLMKTFLDVASARQRRRSHDEEFELKTPGSFSREMHPCVLENLKLLLTDGTLKCPFVFIPQVTTNIEHLFKIYSCLFSHPTAKPQPAVIPFAPLMKTTFNVSYCGEAPLSKSDGLLTGDRAAEERVLSYMVEVGISPDHLLQWPPGVHLPVHTLLQRYGKDPDLSLSPAAFKLLGREDLVAQTGADADDWKRVGLCPSTDPVRSAWQHSDMIQREDDDELLDHIDYDDDKKPPSGERPATDSGDDNVTRLLFPGDHRIADAERLLRGSEPCQVLIAQDAGVNDHEYMEQKQARLEQLNNRTMSLAVGRGMALFRTQVPSTVDAVKIPHLDLTGRDSSNAKVTLPDSSDQPPDHTDWPHFHNGVSAALTIQTNQKYNMWVHLNKPEGVADKAELSMEHAGMLLGLGLNRHVHQFQTLNLHRYLQTSHEMTTIGLLLGLACDKCGSCDLSVLRLLSVHIPVLLPSTSSQIDIPFKVQTAAIAAVGLLYLGSGQRLVGEVMLREIDRGPTGESDAIVDREAYSLSAGFALGLIALGNGDSLHELADLNISNKLYRCMTGRYRRIGSHLSHWSQGNVLEGPAGHRAGRDGSQILEGDRVNTEVTTPAATIALALIYLKTNNTAIAEWFVAPDTIPLLETVRPQHLLLQVVAHSLIMWDHVHPSVEWIKQHVPQVLGEIREDDTLDCSGRGASRYSEVDEHTAQQCYVAVIAGACLSIGLRFAGSQESRAFNTLLHYVDFFMKLSKRNSSSAGGSPIEMIGRRLYDTCLASSLLALCMVVAGSGNLTALQKCRYLHFSTDGGEVNYGMQMAIHMSIGFLFLGGCRYTLMTSNTSIATLLMSVYPCFPVRSSDNRYHLQALRHLYVMGAEKRLLVPIDVRTRRPCYARVSLQYLPSSSSSQQSRVSMIAPCLIPEFSLLQAVSVDDERHWPMRVDANKQCAKLRHMIDVGMYVQLRCGHLPYIIDPKSNVRYTRSGSKNLFDHSTTHSSDHLSFLLHRLCHTNGKADSNDDVINGVQAMTRIMDLLEKHGKLTETTFTFLGLLQVCSDVTTHNRGSLATWQLVLAEKFISRDHVTCQLTRDLVSTMMIQLDDVFHRFLADQPSFFKSACLDDDVSKQWSADDDDDDVIKRSAIAGHHQSLLACYFVRHNLKPPSTPVPPAADIEKGDLLLRKLSQMRRLRDSGLSSHASVWLAH